MSKFPRSRFCRFIASFICLVLVQTAPGLGAYQAFAELRASSSGNATSGAPIRVEMHLHAPTAGLAQPAALGPTSGLSLPNTAATPISATSALTPSASKSAAAAPSATAAAAASALLETGAAVSRAVSADAAAAASEPLAVQDALGRSFDHSRSNKGSLPVLATPAAGNAPALAASAPSAAATPDAQPPVPPSNDGPSSPSRAHVSVGLALAGLGAAAAWYTSAWGAAFLGGLIAPFAAVPTLVLTSVWIAAGALAGLAAFSRETWKGFRADLANTSVSAATNTFRFWAHFGLTFDSVLRGGSTDAATKADLPGNIFKYPLIASPFVLIGYAMAPVAFVLGASYRAIGTSLLAAFRGAREVIVGFLPWMERVFRLISRFVMRIFEFTGGFLWGGLKTAFFALAGGFALAGPIASDALETKYEPSSLPGWIGYRLTQLAALIAFVTTFAVGAAISLLSSPVHVVMGALEQAFAWSGISDSGAAFFKRWMRSVMNDGAFAALVERRFPRAEKNLTLAARATRALNGTLISLYTALFLPFVSLATIIRATSAAYKGVDVPLSHIPWLHAEESGTETAVASRPGFIMPTALAALAGSAAVWAYAAFGAALLAPVGLWAIAAYAAVAAFGAGLGLALSQPQAWRGWLSGALDEGAFSARQSLGGWLDAGSRIAAALRGETAPRAESALVLAIPWGLGSIAAAVSALLAGLHGAAATPIMAAWAGFMAVITQFLPFLKRFVNWAARVLKNIVPFTFGFIFGTIGGLIQAGAFVAVNVFLPATEVSQREYDLRTELSEAQQSAGWLMALSLVAPALAVFVGGFVLGAVIGLPVALTQGLAIAVRWAGTGERSELYFRTWERRSLPNALKKAADVVEISFSKEGPELPIWRIYVRMANTLLAAVPSALALLVSGGKAYARSLSDAALKESPKEESLAPSPNPARPSPAPKADEKPVGKPPVWLAASLGLAGLAVGIYAGVAFGLPAIAILELASWKLWLGYAAVLAATPLAGLSVGLAVSQPLLWTRLIPSTVDHAAAGFSRTTELWTALGNAAGAAWLYSAAGALLGVVWGAAGAVFGAVAAATTAAYEGARQVVYEMLPFLRAAFETAMQVLRRLVPFMFGLLAGSVSGLVGSAAFGALLLGRPYFKHVVADDFKHAGALGFLGNLLLKGFALAFGIGFGLAGVAAGVIVAAPYALTSAVAFAFRFSEIGGPVQRFLDHWTYGALRAEMKRLNELTDRFRFPEGAAEISDGWIRMANILPATFAAAFAGTIAGGVGFFRSLFVAYRSAKSGLPVPSPRIDDETDKRWDRTWSASKKTASSFFSWGVEGALIGLLIWGMSSWTPFGLTGWLLVGAAAAVGALSALAIGSIIAGLALIFWINGQLR